MNLVLDAGGVTALAGDAARLQQLRDRGLWPPLVPSVVLTEALTGDHRRDYQQNRLVRLCRVRSIDESVARRAAVLRTRTTTRPVPSAVDAVVVALADAIGGAIVLTTDVHDLSALARHAEHQVVIATT